MPLRKSRKIKSRSPCRYGRKKSLRRGCKSRPGPKRKSRIKSRKKSARRIRRSRKKSARRIRRSRKKSPRKIRRSRKKSPRRVRRSRKKSPRRSRKKSPRRSRRRYRKRYNYNMESQDGFLRTQEEEYKIVVMDDIDDVLYNRNGNVTDNPDFEELQHGDIVYNTARQDSRENAFNAIMVDSQGQKFVKSISSSTGSGVDIQTDITSRIEDPHMFFDDLENFRQHPIDELFIMLDNNAHADVIYQWSSMRDIDGYKFLWWQNIEELAIMKSLQSVIRHRSTLLSSFSEIMKCSPEKSSCSLHHAGSSEKTITVRCASKCDRASL